MIARVARPFKPTLWLLACETAATLASTELWAAQTDKPPEVAFIIGANEYHTWETLPGFAAEELQMRPTAGQRAATTMRHE